MPNILCEKNILTENPLGFKVDLEPLFNLEPLLK